MSRSNWVVQILSGTSWIDDGTLYRPNKNITNKVTSTQQAIELVDGDEAFITPSTKYRTNQVEFAWLQIDATFLNKIKTYIQNGSGLKIIDHLGTSHIGKFTSLEYIDEVGQDLNLYDISCNFVYNPNL